MENDDALLDAYLMEAVEAGCPSDQMENFFLADLCLQPKQLRASAAARMCDLPDGPTEIGYGGARGGGKSAWSICQLAADDCQRMPGLKCLMLRNMQRSARESLQDLRNKLLRSLEHEFSAHRGLIVFANGSRIISGHFNNEKDIDAYLGIEYDVIVIEEATTISFSTYLLILSCCRSSNPGWRPRIYATTNPGGIGHCLPYGDVLTPDRGWVPIQEVCVGDSVFTVSTSGQLLVREVGQVHAQYYEGDLISISARGLKIECTPEHRIAKAGSVRSGLNTRLGGQKMSLVKYDDLPAQATLLRSVGWTGDRIGKFCVPKAPKKRDYKRQPTWVSGDDYAELMGWFLSEGSTTRHNGGKWFSISQSKQTNRARIKVLLDRCGFWSKWDKSGVNVHGADWHDYFAQFGKCREKFIPNQLKQVSKSQLRQLFNALVNGDGHWTLNEGGSGQFYTTSKRLCGDVCEVALKLGYVVSTHQRQRKNRVGLSYCVNFKMTASGGSEVLTGNRVYRNGGKGKRRSDVSRNRFAGMVYCIGVPETHSFIVRQQGCVWISGNSWFKSRFIKPYVEKKETTTRFIPATVDDNQFLNEGYVKVLESQPGWIMKAWRYGDWDIAAGQFFSNFSERHHIRTEIDERLAKKWFGSFDYGFTHYTCCIIGFWDGDGNAYIVDEHFRRKWLVEQNAEAILSMIGRHSRFRVLQMNRVEAVPLTVNDLDYFVAGTDIFAKKSDGKSVDDEYRAHGIRMTAANTDRINGAATLLRLIGSPDDKKKPIPSKLFIHRRCANVIEQITSAQHDEKNPEDTLKVDADEEGNGGDDAYDAVRYGLHYNQQNVRMQKVRGM